MKLHELAPAPGSTSPKVRVGRGRAGRRGKTAGRGTKGAKARGQIARSYEGGQIPLQMRVPKLDGFKRLGRVEYAAVNLDTLDALDALGAGSTVDPDLLRSRGIVPKKGMVKVLGRGDVTRALTVRANAFSATARSKIEAAGGRAETL
ncbi:MAG TPA: 50S ribosomal protein L15 [Actinomycetota bacterium]|jgi:large subunit ribosomal protein L15